MFAERVAEPARFRNEGCRIELADIFALHHTFERRLGAGPDGAILDIEGVSFIR